jgi:DNA processing protein
LFENIILLRSFFTPLISCYDKFLGTIFCKQSFMHTLKNIILQLSLIDGVGAETIRRIVQSIGKETLLDLHAFSISDFVHRCNLPISRAELIVTGLKEQSVLQKEIEYIERTNSNFLTILDAQYPALLREITGTPPILYYQGASLETHENRCIAVIGSREANGYASRIIEQFIPIFVAHKVTIVSGGARGADAMTHEATVRHNGRTIAVLGSGLLHPYPPEHKRLFATIREAQGTILSIFPMDTRPEAHNFPVRNRVISGLSRGVVIVQAAAKSGTYITARFALDQGREVCAVPGDITERLSAGCHQLLKEGALIADSAQTILDACQITPQETVGEKTEKVIGSVTITPATLEGTIMKLCAQPTLFDDLCAQLNESSSAVQKTLFTLQLSGKVEQHSSGAWIAVR